MKSRHTLLCLMLLTLPLVGFTPARGASLEGDAAVEAGKEAFVSDANAPWYDASSDSVDPLNLEPTPAPKQHAQQSDLSWLYQVLQILGWTALAIVVAAIIFLMIRANTQGNAMDYVEEQAAQQPIHLDRVEELPFALAKPRGDLFSTAEQYYQAGDYASAVVYLYSHMLLELDRAQVIRLSRGKTNRQYLRETKRGSAAGPFLEQTIVAFEDVFFGHHELSRERFEACWTTIPRFQTLLRQSPSEAGLVPA